MRAWIEQRHWMWKRGSAARLSAAPTCLLVGMLSTLLALPLPLALGGTRLVTPVLPQPAEEERAPTQSPAEEEQESATITVGRLAPVFPRALRLHGPAFSDTAARPSCLARSYFVRSEVSARNGCGAPLRC
jgi:hypothetical protein